MYKHTDQQSIAASDDTQTQSTPSFVDLYGSLMTRNYGTGGRVLYHSCGSGCR